MLIYKQWKLFLLKRNYKYLLIYKDIDSNVDINDVKKYFLGRYYKKCTNADILT